MKKVTYSLPPQQKLFLDEGGDKRGISSSEYLRRIIEREEDRTRPPPQEPTDGRG